MTEYNQILLVARPEEQGLGAHLFKSITQTLPTLEQGQFAVKQTHMSLDPAMLGWMASDENSYIPPVPLNTVMRSFGVAEVTESRHPEFAVGELVSGMFGWSEYAISTGEGISKVQPGIKPEMALAVFALPGLTATHGLFNIGKPKSGETIVVTGAAGSVGSIVGQLAKAEGLNVIGVVGSDEKADWIVNDLGFDAAINYKTDDLLGKLNEYAPNGVDVYFENTGGEIQSLVFNKMNAHGRIIVCGMIADYTAETPRPGPNWINAIKKRLTIQGFAMPDHLADAPQLQAKLAPYVLAGKVKYRTHQLDGLEAAKTGLSLLFTGENQGKLMIKL